MRTSSVNTDYSSNGTSLRHKSNSNSTKSIETASHTPHHFPFIKPWHTAKSPTLPSNASVYSSLSKQFIIGEQSNSFIEHCCECMIHTTNRNSECLYAIVGNNIIAAIQECMLSCFRNELELISSPQLTICKPITNSMQTGLGTLCELQKNF